MVNAEEPYSNGEVVDQPSGADDRCGDQAHFAVRLVERLERGRVDEREIIDPGEAGVAQARPRFMQASATGAPPRMASRAASSACGRRQRLLPLLSGQIDVARREGEAVRPRAPSDTPTISTRSRGPRPSGGSPRAAGSPFRRTARRPAEPRSAAWRRLSRRRRNGPAAPRLPSSSVTPPTLTDVAKPCG